MQGRGTLFDVTKPGEYGTPESPKGFIVIQHELLGRQRVFVSSKCFVGCIKQHYKIPETNITSMVDRASLSPRGIPEEPLPDKLGLNMFEDRLKRLADAQGDIIIYCQQGVNRSPVAAVIYLIQRGMPSQLAADLVTNSFRTQRDKKFVLNKREHYTDVLSLAYSRQENSPSCNMQRPY